jgi:hypothetical protein
MESLRGFHPHVAPNRMPQLWYGASIDMRKEVGTANFSVLFQILWLIVIYGARITGDIVINSQVNFLVAVGPPPILIPWSHCPPS